MLLLIQSSEGHTNGDVIVNTETMKLEAIISRKEREKDDSIEWIIKVVLSEASFTEVHNSEEVARERLGIILRSYGFPEDEIKDVSSKYNFHWQENK